MRSKLISSIAEEHRVSKQTVRNYLCLYLSYLDVTILAPKKRKDERELTQDEKHMRWALNKFFYTTKKQSLLSVKLKADAPVTLKQCDRKHPVRNSSHYCLCILHIGRNSRQFMQIKTQAVLKQI